MLLKAQVSADVLITLSILILILGTGAGMINRVRSVSNVYEYKNDFENSDKNTKILDAQLRQERNFFLDTVQAIIGFSGGYGTEFKELPIGCGLKYVEQDFIPQRTVPYAISQVDMIFESSCLMEENLLQDKFIDELEKYYSQTKIDLDLDQSITFMPLVSFPDGEAVIQWIPDIGGRGEKKYILVGDGAREDGKKGTYNLLEPVIISEDKVILFNLRDATQELLKKPNEDIQAQVYSVLQELLLEKTRTDVLFQAGSNCVYLGGEYVCESTYEGGTILTEDNANEFYSKFEETNEKSVDAGYCTVQKNVVGCNDDVCTYGGSETSDGCFTACIDDVGKTNCPTPRTNCDEKCPLVENLDEDKKFICACDKLSDTGLCESAHYYPISLRRSNNQNMFGQRDISIYNLKGAGQNPWTFFKWEKLWPSQICLEDGFYKNDNCCGVTYTPSAGDDCTQLLPNKDMSQHSFDLIFDQTNSNFAYCEPACSPEDKIEGTVSQCRKDTTLALLKEQLNEEHVRDLQINIEDETQDFQLTIADNELSEFFFLGPGIRTKKTLTPSCFPCDHQTTFSTATNRDYTVQTMYDTFNLLSTVEKNRICDGIASSRTLDRTDYIYCFYNLFFDRTGYNYFGYNVDYEEKISWLRTQFYKINQDIADSVFEEKLGNSIITIQGTSCQSDYDCDPNLDELGLLSVCEEDIEDNTRCKTCSSTNRLNTIYTESGNSFVCTTEGFLTDSNDRDRCTANIDCDPNLGNEGLRSICGGTYNIRTLCQTIAGPLLISEVFENDLYGAIKNDPGDCFGISPQFYVFEDASGDVVRDDEVLTNSPSTTRCNRCSKDVDLGKKYVDIDEIEYFCVELTNAAYTLDGISIEWIERPKDGASCSKVTGGELVKDSKLCGDGTCQEDFTCDMYEYNANHILSGSLPILPMLGDRVEANPQTYERRSNIG